MRRLKPEFDLPNLRRQLEEILAIINGNGAALDRGANDGTAISDNLYKDALVVVTEFGQASPAILQMWLSIDYGSAITILHRFQAEGLTSSKGRVRHKAFTLLRSLDQQT